MTHILLESVSRYFEGNQQSDKGVLAVDNISLEITDGQVLAIVGESGCGKTSLLRMIAGIDEPSTGKVFHNGKYLRDLPLDERNIGMVFQDYALIPHWDSEKTIGFFLRLRKREREVPQHVHEVSRITGIDIDNLMDKFPRQLSGGEKQRVAIARAFARDLNLLLLDEPFANLDAQFRSNARLELRRLLNQFGVTTVYVTHDQQEAAALADRVIVMKNGRIVQDGAFETLLNDPQSVYVARLIGVPIMNLFEGIIQDDVWTHEHLPDIPLPVTAPIDAEPQIIIGIRPKEVRIITDDAGYGKIIAITPYFAERYQLVDVQIGDELCQVEIPFNDNSYAVGQQVNIDFDEAKVYVFDALSGDRIV